MAYAAEYVAALEGKKLEGLFVNDYIASDNVANAVQFKNGASVNNAGGIEYTVIRNRRVAGAAASRARGVNYPVVNADPMSETFSLKSFGGAFTVDTSYEEILGNVNAENEVREKMSAGVEEFVRQLIKGDGVANTFLGMEKYCGDNNMAFADTLDISGAITEDKAISFLNWFNVVKGKLAVDANAICVSRTFASTLETFAALLNRYTQPIKIGALDYPTFLGVPILKFDDTVGLRTDIDADNATEDMYLTRWDENKGVFCASPADKKQFVRVVKPVQIGQPNAQGFVDFFTCFVPKNRKALIGGTIKVK
jgi:hypothetical protein